MDKQIWEADDESSVVIPCKSLRGWQWRQWADGSGHLEKPNSEYLFSFDRIPYQREGGIEYRNQNRWEIFWGSFEEFMSYAEELCQTDFGMAGDA